MYGFWAAVLKRNRELLGWFVFRSSSANSHEAEIGYRFQQHAWGSGYATEGARALIEKGFRDGGVTRVTATAYSRNQASRRVMEKTGMKFLRSFRITAGDLASADTAHVTSSELWDEDDVEYSLTLAEWGKSADC